MKRPLILILAVAIPLALVLLWFGFVARAMAHEGHTITNSQYVVPQGDNVVQQKEQGRFSSSGDYLFGIQRDRTSERYGQTVNCCQYGGDGDCQIMRVEGVKIVPGGYEVDGEFIAEAETTASPDDNYYRCQHAGKPSHCFFAPPQGF